ncbi:MAG TPA: phosphotransferase family protein [Candidatus Binataceae bacterium]|nr:phosphotransferase family protein [Candidatus Binataceae bacterium]
MTAPADIADQLLRFVRDQTGDRAATVRAITVLPGHAGQSYSFTLERQADGAPISEKLVLRLAPAGVRIAGPADVVRQARIMRSLAGTAVPAPPIRWFGDDPEWFGRPYFVASFVSGDKLALGEREFAPADQPQLACATMRMLATLHALPWASRREAWGEPQSLADELERLDSLLDRPTLDPVIVADAPRLRERLRRTLPTDARIGCVHGDLNWTNCIYENGQLRAVIDWELAQIGAVLIDLGWICLFSDRPVWVKQDLIPAHIQSPDELVAIYREQAQSRESKAEIDWFRAFACYRFGVITAFNVMLHRRGKRVDPMWEDIALSGPRFFARGLELLA